MAKYGFVYIMTNQVGVYKIGCTSGSPRERAAQLSASSGVLHEFDVICYGEFEDFQIVERQMHERFDDRRINANREFFRGPFTDLYLALRDGFDGHIVSFCEGEGPVYVYDEGRERELSLRHEPQTTEEKS